MISLRELQRQFVNHLLNDDESVEPAWIVPNGLRSGQRLQVYRNGARIGFEQAMQASYPALLRLSGEPWFNQTAQGFRRRHPSRSGDLNQVGVAFADYLQGLLQGGEFAYFIDVARLEWSYQQLLNDAEAPPGNLQELNSIAEVDMARLRFTMNASARILASDYPLFEIWRRNRGAIQDFARIDLRQGPSRILLIRRADHVEVRELPLAAFALLQAFAAAVNADEAACTVSRAIGEFDLQDALVQLIKLHAVTGFSLMADEDVHVG